MYGATNTPNSRSVCIWNHGNIWQVELFHTRIQEFGDVWEHPLNFEPPFRPISSNTKSSMSRNDWKGARFLRFTIHRMFQSASFQEVSWNPPISKLYCRGKCQDNFKSDLTGCCILTMRTSTLSFPFLFANLDIWVAWFSKQYQEPEPVSLKTKSKFGRGIPHGDESSSRQWGRNVSKTLLHC